MFGLRLKHALFVALLTSACALVPLCSGWAAGVSLPVPRTTIHPGDEIRDDLIVENRFPAATAQRFAVIDNRRDLKGKLARRTLLPGQPIPINAVAAPMLVKRGEPARLIFREAGLSIVTLVNPMQSGGSGDVVKVRNSDSGVMVIGTVQPDGSILVGN